MMNNKSGIVTVEAAIFLAVVTIALVAGFTFLADELYVPAVSDDPSTTGVNESAPASGVLGDFIADMKAAIR